MLLLSILFFVGSLYASDSQLTLTRAQAHDLELTSKLNKENLDSENIEVLFVRPSNLTHEKFKSQVIELVHKLEDETASREYVLDKIKQVDMMSSIILSAPKSRFIDVFPNIDFDKKEDSHVPVKHFLNQKIELAGWVKGFLNKYQQSLSEKSEISLEGVSNILEILSKSIIEQNSKEDDFLSKEIQLLKLFNIIHKRVFVDARNAMEQILDKHKKEGRAEKDAEITDEMYLIEVCKALMTANLGLKIDQSNQISVPDSSMQELTDKVIDLIGKRLEEECLKKEKNALIISKFLIASGIPANEFATMTRGQQGIAILIASILIDSPLGKEFSKEPYQDYKRMLLDLERITETIRNNINLNLKPYKKNLNPQKIESYFQLIKENIYLALSKKLMFPEFVNVRCVIKDGKLYFNEALLLSLVPSIIDEIMESLIKNENEKQLLQTLAALQKSASMPASSSSSTVDNNSKKLSEKQMEMAKQRVEQRKLEEEEAKRKQEEIERQKKAHLEKIEKAKQAKQAKEKEAALALEQKAKQEAERQKLKRQKELEKQAALNEARKKKEEGQERLREFKVKLYEESQKLLLELEQTLNSLLSESEQDLEEIRKKEQEEKNHDKFFKRLKYNPKISSSNNRFIHNGYARFDTKLDEEKKK